MPNEGFSPEEQEIYDKGLRALEDVLASPDPKSKVKAAELAFKLVGKLNNQGDGTAPTVQIAKILQVIQAPVTKEELKEAERFIETGKGAHDSTRTSRIEKAVQRTLDDCEQGEDDCPI